MLTACVEYRLSLHANNAGRRLTKMGVTRECVGQERAERHRHFAAAVSNALARARADGGTPARLAAMGLLVKQDGAWRSMLDLLAVPAIGPGRVSVAFPWLRDLSAEVRAELEAKALYASYLERAAAERAALAHEEGMTVPAGIDFAAGPGSSAEMRHRLAAARPASLGAAGRVAGVTPAALAALSVHLRRHGQRFT